MLQWILQEILAKYVHQKHFLILKIWLKSFVIYLYVIFMEAESQKQQSHSPIEGAAKLKQHPPFMSINSEC